MQQQNPQPPRIIIIIAILTFLAPLSVIVSGSVSNIDTYYHLTLIRNETLEIAPFFQIASILFGFLFASILIASILVGGFILSDLIVGYGSKKKPLWRITVALQAVFIFAMIYQIVVFAMLFGTFGFILAEPSRLIPLIISIAILALLFKPDVRAYYHGNSIAKTAS